MEEEQQEVNNEVPQEEQGGGEVAPMDDNDPTDHIPAVASLDQYIEVEKEKRKQRAERFGIEVRELNPEIITAPIRKRYRNTRPELTEEEKAKKEQRALRFGIPTTTAPAPMQEEEEKPAEAAEDDGMMEVDIREERQDVNAFVPRRLDTIHVYGTDDLDTAALFAFFKDYNPQFAEWINDSSCNIVFKDQDSSFNALEALSTPMENFASLVPEGADEQTVAKLNLGSYSWREGTTSSNKKLLLRIATTADIRPTKPKPSVFYKKLFDEPGSKRRKATDEKYVEVERLDRPPRKDNNRNQNRNNNDREQNRGKGRQQRKQRSGLDAAGIIPLDDQEMEKRKRRQQRFNPSFTAEESVDTTTTTGDSTPAVDTNSDANLVNTTENTQ